VVIRTRDGWCYLLRAQYQIAQLVHFEDLKHGSFFSSCEVASFDHLRSCQFVHTCRYIWTTGVSAFDCSASPRATRPWMLWGASTIGKKFEEAVCCAGRRRAQSS